MEPAKNDLFAGFNRIWFRIILVSLIAWILIVLGAFLLVVPAILFTLMFLLTEFVMIDNNRIGAMSVLERSRVLSKGSRRAIFHVCVIYLGAGMVLSLLFSSIPNAWGWYSLTSWTGWVAVILANAITWYFLYPPFIMALAVYYEKCLKAEAAAALRMAPPPVTPPPAP